MFTFTNAKTRAQFFTSARGQRTEPTTSPRATDFWKIVHCKAGGRLVEIIANFDTEAEALQHELFLTWSLRVFGIKLTNLVDGGGGTPGWNHSPAARAKMSSKRKGFALSEKHADAIRDGVRTPESRARKRAAQLRRYSDPIQLAFAQKINTEINSRPEVREKISSSLSAARRAVGAVSPVECVTTGQRFDCIVDAAAWVARQAGKLPNQARTSIINSIKRNGTAYGYRWKYLPKINACEVSQL